MASRLEKSDPGKLAFRFSTLGATLQAAQDFSVIVDVQFGGNEHARFREGEGGLLVAPEGTWVPGAIFSVLAERLDGGLLVAVPAADTNYHLGLTIGGFTIGEDGHPDPASAWDLNSGSGGSDTGRVIALDQLWGAPGSLPSQPPLRQEAQSSAIHSDRGGAGAAPGHQDRSA